MTEAERRRTSQMQAFTGGVLLTACATMILFSGSFSFSRADVQWHLNQFADYIAARAEEEGKEGRFSYGTVTLKGWGYDKYATIQNLSIEVTEPALLDTTKWSASTSHADVLPDRNVKERLSFIFTDPVNVIENSQLKTTISYPSPIKYTISQKADDGKAIQHTIKLPPQLIFDQPKSAGDIAPPRGRIVIAYNENPTVQIKYFPESDTQKAEYEFRNIRLTSEDGLDMRIGALEGRNHEVRSKGRLEGKYDWDVGNIVINAPTGASEPYTLSLEAGYMGDIPRIDLKRHIPVFDDMDITISQFVFGSESFRISATGRIASVGDDPIPFGALDVEIQNPERFVASPLVPAAFKGTVTQALQTASGKPLEGKIRIPLTREKNGALYIGGHAFEELAAAALDDILEAVPSKLPILPPPQNNEELFDSPTLTLPPESSRP